MLVPSRTKLVHSVLLSCCDESWPASKPNALFTGKKKNLETTRTNSFPRALSLSQQSCSLKASVPLLGMGELKLVGVCREHPQRSLDTEQPSLELGKQQEPSTVKQHLNIYFSASYPSQSFPLEKQRINSFGCRAQVHTNMYQTGKQYLY